MKKVSNRLYLTQKIIDYIGVVFLGLLLLFIWQLYRGPIELPFLKPYMVRALNHDDAEYQVTVDSVNIELVRSIQPIKIIANNVVYRKNDGSFIINAPKTSVSFSIKALLRGVIAPSSMEALNPTVYIFNTYGVDKENINDVNKKKIAYYFDSFEDFIERFNSDDNFYPESYINKISVKNAEVELHEVDLGRKWIFSDLNYLLERNLTNISMDVSALMKLNNQVASVGVEAEYRMLNNKLAVEFYFSDLVPNALAETFLDKNTADGFYKINLPVSGRVATVIDFNEVIKYKDDIMKSVDTAFEKIDFQFEGGRGNIMFNEDAAYNYNIAAFLLEGAISGGLNELKISNADFDLGSQKAKIDLKVSGVKSFLLENSLKDLKVNLSAAVKEMNFDDLYNYWPRYLSDDAWSWCKDSIRGGQIKNVRFDFRFAYDDKSKNFGLADLSGNGDISDTNLNYLKEMPDITNLYGRAHFSKTNIKIDVDKGVSEGVILTGGYVNLYDLDKYNNYADIDLKLSSSVTDALRLIDNPPLGYTSEMGLKPDALQGQAETELGLKFEIKNDLTPEEVEVKVKSDLTEVRVPDAFKNKTVTADELKLEVDNQGLALSGDAKLENIPLKLSWNERFADKNYRSRYKLSAKFNNALKKELDFDSSLLNPPYVDGYALVDAEITVYNDRKTVVNLNAQIDKMAVDFAFLGFKKPVNERGNLLATLNIYDNKLVSLPKFSLFKDDFKIEGKIDLTADGNIKTVDITNISGPRTAAKARIDIAHAPKKKVKINISGTSYDLTPFFDRDENKIKVDRATLIKTPEDEDDELEDVTDTDIFIAVNNLWTNPHVPVTNFAGSAKLLNGIGVNEIHMVGNYNNNKKSVLKFDYVPRPNKEFLLSVDSNDAGATLKVLRVYNNMKGGNIQVEARRNAQKEFIGHAKIRDFSIYNTPVIAKLLTVASFSGMVDLLMGEGLTFSHFDAPFEYRNRQLSLKEAKAFGDVVGITAQGTYDRRFDEVNFHGVIAPAYSLNTMLGKIPLVGNLLVGKDGTVFAANYSATGSVEDAEIDINPLSALSPSSLKDKFNALFGGDGN
jgi:hypothetical protein